MSEIRSGKELCDDFFNKLTDIPDVELKVANLVIDLYNKQQLTTDKVRKALKTLRQESQNEKQNKD
jgi:hypothetical protein